MEVTNKTPIDMLLTYQVPHVYQLYESLLNTQCVLDGSDTGTGKTYATMAVCYLLKLKPFIICPRSVINSWIDVSKKMNIEIVGLSNYERLKGGKYYTQNFELTECPYLDKIEINENEEKEILYLFQFPTDTIVIVDEAHKCKNYKTENSEMILSLKNSQRKILLLSATITDKIKCFKPFGAMFGLYREPKNYKDWIKNKIKLNKVNKRKDMTDDGIALKIIHDSIYPIRGSRMRIKELGDMFPKNQILAKCYYVDEYSQVDEIYEVMNKTKTLKDLTNCRILLESIKLQVIIELVEDGLENDFSIAIFVNFKESLNYLVNNISEKCSVIHGDQSIEERQQNIDDFQSNKVKVIVCIMQAGGIGISLHDLYGRQRMSIISPNYNATELVQCLGRIHRAGSKSPALQRIVYIAKSCEEEICKKLSEKMNVLSKINGDDLIDNDDNNDLNSVLNVNLNKKEDVNKPKKIIKKVIKKIE